MLMIAHERHLRIRQVLAQRGSCTVAALRDLLGVSAATLRRDLTLLERLGEVVRSHGGVMDPSRTAGEPPFAGRMREAVEAKQRIAERAVALIPPGATVFVDAGSSALALGQRLLERGGHVLYTNSLPLLQDLRAQGAKLVCIGGERRDVSQALVGGLALDWLGRLHFDVAVLGASGLDAREGASTTELMEAAVKREVLQRAGRSILLADARKWGRPAAVCFSSWDRIADWVTDYQPTRRERETLRRLGTTVHTCGPRAR